MALHFNFQGTALEFIEILVTSVRNYGQIWRPGVKDGLSCTASLLPAFPVLSVGLTFSGLSFATFLSS
jgi:hypothetical protein